jgi:hypothetical protein
MVQSTGTDKPVCQHSYWQFQLVGWEHGGYGLVCPCERGDHWLAPDPATPGAYMVSLEPFAWLTSLDAVAARDAWRSQERQ